MTIFMVNILLDVSCFAVFFCVVMLIRNNLVYKIRRRKLAEVSEKAKSLIDTDGNWRQPYSDFDSLSYDKMLWQLHKWTYKSFYIE